MASLFFRRFASVVHTKLRAAKPQVLSARPGIESLDKRILPSVSANLKGGILKVIADPHHGTSQVEIIQSPGQITVEDTGTVVNSFDPTQIQQIDFKFREGLHQHGHFDLTIPVNQQQMTLAGYTVNETDLGLGAGALAATVAATLADGTPVSLTGTVDSQGNYDVSGNADLSVAGFTLPGAALELTPAGMTVSATASLGGASVNFGGTVDSQGNYDLTGAANVTVAGFPLNANFELTNASLNVAATANVANIGNLAFNGSVDNAGSYHLTASAPVTLAGFSSVGAASFALSNAGMTASAAMNLVLATVNMSGAVQPSGQYSLSGTANIGMGGFDPVPATFTLTNTGATVAATVNVVVATVPFSGPIQPNGSYTLTGSAAVTLGGFGPATGHFTLINTGLSVAASVNVLVATVDFSGSISRTGTYALTGTANVSLAGFPVSPANFTLTNSGCTLNTVINVSVATAAFSGTVDPHGNFHLTATANVSFAGFTPAATSLVLTNSGCTLSANINITVGTVAFTGTVDPHGNFQLTANAHLSLAGFGVAAALTLSNSGLSVTGTPDLSVMGTRAPLSGHIASNGSFTLTSNANINFATVTSTLTLTLANSGLTAHVHATDDVSDQVNFGTWSVRIGFRGSFDANFAIATNGTFNASGSFAMTSYEGLTGITVTIGYSITDHQFLVRNSQIGFSIWGIGFHPFADAVDNY